MRTERRMRGLSAQNRMIMRARAQSLVSRLSTQMALSRPGTKAPTYRTATRERE